MPLPSVRRTLLKASLSTPWAALVLVLVAWAVYHPALNRVFADDQINYLAELGGHTSLFDGLRHYDYAATRRFWKGDDALFRPLLFVWLAAGNHLFSYHHVWWNAANLGLHVLVALALFRLLIAVRPSPFALPAAVLFLVLKPPFELVVWNHLGGYLLAFLFFAIGARAFVRLTCDDDTARHELMTYAWAFTAAGLFYEALAVVSLIGAGIVLWIDWRKSRRLSPGRAVFLLAPLLLFAVLYAFHALRVQRLTYVDRPEAGDRLQVGDLLKSVSLEATVAAHWTAEFALPSAVHLSANPFYRFVKRFEFSWTDPLHRFNALLALASAVLLAWAMTRRQAVRAGPLLVFLAATCAIYIAVLGFGRAEVEILQVTYYTYLFGLICTVFAYALVDFDRLYQWRWLSAPAGLVLLLVIALHASESARTARAVERVNHYPSMYLGRVITFVDAHANEPDFTFAIQPHPESVDPEIHLVEGYLDDPKATSQRRRLTEILFARYYNSAAPKYLLDASATKLAQPSP